MARLKFIEIDGKRYAKAGIMLNNLVPAGHAPRSLFSRFDSARSARLMEAVDGINADMGSGTVYPAAMGIQASWRVKFGQRSPSWTTKWDELPRVLAC